MRTRTRRLASTLGTSLVLAGLVTGLAVTPAYAEPPTVIEVRASDISATRDVANGGWWYDNVGTTTGGDFIVSRDGSPDNDLAMKLGVYDVPGNTDKVYLHSSFGADARPTDLPALLAGASYVYAGLNVNFQIEVVFEPNDVDRYGPAGTARACTPASTWYGWGLAADPDWCYTVLKWEPYVQPGTAAWTHVDLSVDTAASSPLKRGGWVSHRNLGQYPGNVTTGQLMSEYLAQMAEYEVTGFVFGIGSGTPGPAFGYVKQYTIGGTTYTFVPEEPAPAPVADSAGLETLIDDEGIDVESDTEQFVTTGEENRDLGRVDATKPMEGRYENWKNPSDAFADVYTFSTATFIGTFPVIGGHVILDGANLRHLAPGPHHFLFRGQSSGAVAVVAFTVIGAGGGGGTLPPTGPADTPALLLGAALLLAAGLGFRAAGRRAARG